MESLKKFVNSLGEMDGQQQGSQGSNASSSNSIPGVSRSGGTLNSSLISQAVVSQRIVNVEYYMSPPVKEFDNIHSEFRNSAIKKVPVIRIFGTTPAGQKMCANIHGVYPYISILDDETVDGFEYRIATALDNAINDSMGNKFGKNDQPYKNTTQHVFKAIKIVGKTFYGYRSCSEVFIRIFFYSPIILRKAVDLLQGGNVLGRRFQPYESHIPYSLQFMIDYCLYGMNYIHYAAVKFRRNSPDNSPKYSEDIPSLSQSSTSSIAGYIDPDSIDESMLGPTQLSRLTLCELEIDVLASDIVADAKTSEKAMSVNPGIDCIWKDEIERRRMHGVENCSQITIPESQERLQAPSMHPAEDKYMQILGGKLQSFLDNQDESMVEENSNPSFINSSYNEDADIVHSSQVLDHLSGESPPEKDLESNNTPLSQDEFMQLLEKMAEEAENPTENKVVDDPFGKTINENYEIEDSTGGEVIDDEDIWDELNVSILDQLSDDVIISEKAENGSSEHSSGSPKMIFQCDGQTADSDSNSDDNAPIHGKKETKAVVNTRLSRRMSEVKVKASASTNKNKTGVGVDSKHKLKRKAEKNVSHHKSPVSRLSLTLRRKSKSQEVLKSKPQVSDAVPMSCPSQSTRRSRSMSVEKDKAKLSPTKSSSKKVINEIKTDEVSKRITRMSLSATSSVNSTVKEKSGSNKNSTAALSSKAQKKMNSESKKDVQPSKNKVLKKPVVLLKKVDVDAVATKELPKRLRRIPSRLEGFAVGNKSGSQSDKTIESGGEQQQVVAEISESQKTEAEVPKELSQNKTKKLKEKVLKKPAVVSSEVLTAEPIAGSSKEISKDVSHKRTKKNGKLKPSVEDRKSMELRQDKKVQEKTIDKDINTKKNFSKISEDKGEIGKNGVKPLSIVKKKKKRKIKVIAESNSDDSERNGHDDNMEKFIEIPKESKKSRDDLKSFDVDLKEVVSSSEKEDNLSDSGKPLVIAAPEQDKEKLNVQTRVESKEEPCASNHVTPVEKPKLPIVKKKRLGLQISKRDKNVVVASASSNSEMNNSEITRLSSGAVVQKNSVSPDIVVFKSSKVLPANKQDDARKAECIDKKESSDIGINCKPDYRSTKCLTVENASSKKNIGIICKPDYKSTMCLTVENASSKKNASILAQPHMKDSSSQMEISSTSSVTQTELKQMVTVETQTDAIVPLCLCQCTCVMKEKSDASVDSQNDLKPVTENKRIQVDNSDIIARVRSSRYITPQGNKIKRATPSKSPEKRRSFHDSPSGRRHSSSSSTSSHSSRYLSALVLKTPTSHHRHRSYGRSSPSAATPEDSSSCQEVENGGPSPRESREGYLINSIRAASTSPRRRSSHIKPRNLEVETNCNSAANNMQVELSVISLPENHVSSSTADVSSPSIEDEMLGVMESYEGDDLSVNSIYEYEEPSSALQSPAVALPPEEEEEEEEEVPSPALLTSFQMKRIQSKHRSKHRLEKRRAANIDANRGIPDVFELEYEPLKQPASYKSTIKWLDSEGHRIYIRRGKSDKDSDYEETSDEECLPPPVKLFGGGNLSDNEDSDSSDAHASRSRDIVKPFTPPEIMNFFTPSTNKASSRSLDASVYYTCTPRSILRQSASGSSRRHSGRVLKRKIRWEDEEEPCKKIKTEEDGIVIKVEVEDDSQLSLHPDGTFNKTADLSELDGPSFKNVLGLENSMSNFQDVKAVHQCQFLTTMCVEVHCSSRNELLPDPAIDPIMAIFVLVSNDYPDGFKKPKEHLHLLLLDEKVDPTMATEGECRQSIKAYSNEGDLIDAFIALVRLCDPDIMVGYEIEKSSFGYLIQRGLYFGKELSQELSRVLPVVRKQGEKDNPFRSNEEWNGTFGGRIVLNLWRLLRHEMPVQSYTFENAAYHILHRRVCKFPQKTLHGFWLQKPLRHKVIQYYTVRVKGATQIMETLDLINRTSELARLFGIQFYEVLSRGSQFRVESMMLRATKPLDLIAPSPTVPQRAKMRAPEFLPLILEPRSNYYTDPVAVLDFQSLYPSMMIAYNYDYASLIGRVEHLGENDRFPIGCLDHAISPAELLRLKDHIHVSPAGVAFVDKSIVKGVLPEMLEQILDTRQMVKRAMKTWKNDGASLHKVLDSRQLGLKLIANVTYGYTSANFSGRMPCVDIADSIVSKGRETLQRAIAHVKENYHRWGGDVVYGDTDSMFILFKGKSREEAFKLAYEIADEVTQANPKPVKLKFEKIYQPCILQSKKRYVGHSYETPDQVTPTLDAKGIETVRRDGCPAVKKILENTLKILFTYNKRDKVERFLKAQFEKLFKGRVSMQDYIFAREFRGRQGYKPAACVPSLEIAKKLSAIDPRAEPLVSERVPYVVTYGSPTLPLIKLVRTPDEYLKNPAMRLNAHYYIEKAIIPALNRCLIHAGLNAMNLYLSLPRKYLRNFLEQKTKGQGTLDNFVLHQNCLRCDDRAEAERGLCRKCLFDESGSIIYLQEVLRNANSKLHTCVEICRNCAGVTDGCISIDCPVLHKLTRYQRDQAYMNNIKREIVNLEQKELDW